MADEQAPVTDFHGPGRRRLLGAVVVGSLSSLVYFAWWARDGRLGEVFTLLMLAPALIWVALQIWGAWVVYLSMEPTPETSTTPGLDVDVFLPVFDEPPELVEAALQAALSIHYPHRTVLLDDSPGYRYRDLARELGVDHVTRDEHHHAKAGNVNHALEFSKASFVTIFDLDHIPEPDYLDEVLGHFSDPKVGFVQRGIAFGNQDQSWVAHAASDQAADPYGPTSQGMFGCGAAPVWGSHTTFRRTALDDIGGYRPGLAEDLHTSVRLHAAGWRSVFVPNPAATGLAPIDLLGMYKQQFKWARGVFEVLLHVLPRNFGRLSMHQRIAYLLRSTYYTIGAAFLIHCLIALFLLLRGDPSSRASFSEYLFSALPLAVSFVAVRTAAMAAWKHRPTASWSWRGYLLTLFMWPAYVLALLASVLGLTIRHIPTPKRPSDRQPAWLWLPPVTMGLGLAMAGIWRLVQGWHPGDLLLLLFAFGTAGLQLLGAFVIVRNRP